MRQTGGRSHKRSATSSISDCNHLILQREAVDGIYQNKKWQVLNSFIEMEEVEHHIPGIFEWLPIFNSVSVPSNRMSLNMIFDFLGAAEALLD